MKNTLPLILYVGIVGSLIMLLGLQRESARSIMITYSQQLNGDYYLYKKEDKLVYIATSANKNTWGKETVKPCIYEVATYQNYIITKSHPIVYSFPDSKVSEGMSRQMYKEINVDSTRIVYSLVDMNKNTVTILPEWVLFQTELSRCSIPANLQFSIIKDKP